MNASDDNERVEKHRAAGILGVPVRTVIDMAAHGRLPGAAKIGRAWTFDESKLRHYVKMKEREAWHASQAGKHRQVAIGARVSFGAEFKKSAATSDGAYTRATRLLRSA
jgi:Helix-turn-helix domain